MCLVLNKGYLRVYFWMTLLKTALCGERSNCFLFCAQNSHYRLSCIWLIMNISLVSPLLLSFGKKMLPFWIQIIKFYLYYRYFKYGSRLISFLYSISHTIVTYITTDFLHLYTFNFLVPLLQTLPSVVWISHGGAQTREYICPFEYVEKASRVSARSEK